MQNPVNSAARHVVLVASWSDCPPVGALYIANALEQAGYKIRLCNVTDEISVAIREVDPLFVAFSVHTTPAIAQMVSQSELVKRNFDIPVVWGGPHATFTTEQCIATGCVDHIVCGDGEDFIVDLVGSLASTGTFDTVCGSWDYVVELDRFRPAWHLMDLTAFIYPGSMSVHVATDLDLESIRVFKYHITSRGCKYRCSFCYNSFVPRRQWNCHSVDWVKEQVLFFQRELGIDGIEFWDDMFFGDIDRGALLIEFLASQGMKFVCEARADMVDAPFAKWLKDSGCLQLYIGGESGSDFVLRDLISKGINVSDILAAANATHSQGLPTRYHFMYGIPGESREDVLLTLELMEKLRQFSNVSVNRLKLYTPVPGTTSYTKALELGFIAPSSTVGWMNIHRSSDPSMLPWVNFEIAELISESRS